LRPELVVVAETEFWPNFLRLAKRSGARIAVVNARISDRSFPRYRAWRRLLRRVIAPVDIFLAQTAEDVRRLVEIGAEPQRVAAAGNLKFDIAAPAAAEIVELLREGMAQAGSAHLIVCGSTVEGEEPHLLRTFRTVLAQERSAVMLLAPRHPERFEQVAGYLQQSGLSWWRRSHLGRGHPLAGGVVLLDTIGELAAAYQAAALAFVGGSLVPRGGHNILEAAQHGVPILVGPHTENFRDIVEQFVRAGGARVTTIPRLDNDFIELLSDAALAKTMGEAARALFRAQAGATERTLAALEDLPAPEAARGACSPACSARRCVPATRSTITERCRCAG
jgi:3-deoxy-D-manno-octulosonic-acid transferase